MMDEYQHLRESADEASMASGSSGSDQRRLDRRDEDHGAEGAGTRATPDRAGLLESRPLSNIEKMAGARFPEDYCRDCGAVGSTPHWMNCPSRRGGSPK